MTRAERNINITDFHEDPSITVFLMSLKVGGIGLNLTDATQVFLIDPVKE